MTDLSFLTALLAISAGRHFIAPSLPPRERETLTVAFVLYFILGLANEICDDEVLCGVFVLSFEVRARMSIRITIRITIRMSIRMSIRIVLE